MLIQQFILKVRGDERIYSQYCKTKQHKTIKNVQPNFTFQPGMQFVPATAWPRLQPPVFALAMNVSEVTGSPTLIQSHLQMAEGKGRTSVSDTDLPLKEITSGPFPEGLHGQQVYIVYY